MSAVRPRGWIAMVGALSRLTVPMVPIKTFESGAQSTTPPLALWFVVLCNMQGYEAQGSGLFRGQINLFNPALKYLEKQGRVAVAHWCDDGQSKIDLPVTGDFEEALTSLEQVLAPIPDTKDHDRAGELALQKTWPEPLPVVIFLYGDHNAPLRGRSLC
jgi:hypothetical protein